MSQTGSLAPDTSIYDKLQPPNIIGMMGQLANMRNAQNENLQFQQQFRARIAMGRIMQQSVGPDGQPDLQKAALLAAQDPDAAFLAPDMLANAMKTQGVQLANFNQKLENIKTQRMLEGNAAAGLAAMPNPTHKDAVNTINNLMDDYRNNGIDDPKVIGGLISLIPTIPPVDGAPITQWAQQHQQIAAGAADGLDRFKQNMQTVDTGPTIEVYNHQAQTGRLTHITSLPKGVSPETAAAPQQIQVTADNASQFPGAKIGDVVSYPRFQMPGVPLPGRQYGGGGAPAAQAGGGAGWPTPPSANLSPRPAPSPGTLSGAPSLLPKPPASPEGPPVTGLGPFSSGQLHNAADYGNDINNQVSTINVNQQNLQKLAELADQVKTGMGATQRKDVAAALLALGMPQTLVNKVGNGGLAASQEIQKYAIQGIANTMRTSLGEQSRVTNYEMGMFSHAAPTLETSPTGFRDMLQWQQHLGSLKQRELAAWNYANKQKRDPSTFQDDWTRHLYQTGELHPLAGAQ